jgi:hypothetical protein
MAAVVATRRNPTDKMFYQWLVWVEKANKVAVIVCTRKLPTTLNTMLTDRARWRTEPPQHT